MNGESRVSAPWPSLRVCGPASQGDLIFAVEKQKINM